MYADTYETIITMMVNIHQPPPPQIYLNIL